MIAKQQVTFKGIREIPGGSFINEKGQNVNYNTFYKFRFEMPYNGFLEIFEIKCTKEFAINCVKNTNINDKLNVTFVFNIFPKGKIDCKIQSIEKI